MEKIKTPQNCSEIKWPLVLLLFFIQNLTSLFTIAYKTYRGSVNLSKRSTKFLLAKAFYLLIPFLKLSTKKTPSIMYRIFFQKQNIWPNCWTCLDSKPTSKRVSSKKQIHLWPSYIENTCHISPSALGESLVIHTNGILVAENHINHDTCQPSEDPVVVVIHNSWNTFSRIQGSSARLVSGLVLPAILGERRAWWEI